MNLWLPPLPPPLSSCFSVILTFSLPVRHSFVSPPPTPTPRSLSNFFSFAATLIKTGLETAINCNCNFCFISSFLCRALQKGE